MTMLYVGSKAVLGSQLPVLSSQSDKPTDRVAEVDEEAQCDCTLSFRDSGNEISPALAPLALRVVSHSGTDRELRFVNSDFEAVKFVGMVRPGRIKRESVIGFCVGQTDGNGSGY